MSTWRGIRRRIQAATAILMLAASVVVPSAVAQTVSAPAQPSSSPPAEPVAPPPPPLRLISTSQRGRIADLVARAIAPQLSRSLSREVRVESHGQDDGRRAAELLLAAPADGNTVLIADARLAALDGGGVRSKGRSALLLPRLVPLARLTERPLVLVTGSAQPFRTLDQFVSAARRRRDGITLAVTAQGGPLHLAGLRLDASLGGGLKLVALPMGGATIAAVLARKAQAAIATLPTAQDFAHQGHLRILANLGASRPAALRSLPTLAERRIPVTASLWTAAFLRRETPAQLQQPLAEALARALAARETATELKHLQEDAGYLSGEALHAFWQREQEAAAGARRAAPRHTGR
ncbi:MAG: tripartite tricarboxylate transporter substrate-binding protein [Hyphomicrobiaceae bacterium]